MILNGCFLYRGDPAGQGMGGSSQRITNRNVTFTVTP